VLTSIDLTALPETERTVEARRLFAREAGRPFDLTHGLLLRAMLLRLSEREHLCLVNKHHIASDYWSLGVLMREVGILYAAFSQGLPSPLPSLPVQYADYAVWQRDWLRGEILERQIGFWRNTLAGVPTRLDFPTDRPRPPFLSGHTSSRSHKLSITLVESLVALARSWQATLEVVLLAAWQSLLAKLTGQCDFAIGVPVTGRRYTQVEGLIGPFENLMVLRACIDEKHSFTALVEEVRQLRLAAYNHSDFPFELLIETLRPDFDPSRAPLVQTSFGLREAATSHEELPSLIMAPLDFNTNASIGFDMSLTVTPAEDQLITTAAFASAIFDVTTIQRWLDDWTVLLTEMAADPSRRLGDILLFSPAEVRQVLNRQAESHGTFISPQTPIEKIVATIWEELLGIHHVGIDDSFFDLGGDSIRAIELKDRLASIGHPLGLMQIFKSPTVRELAAELEPIPFLEMTVIQAEYRNAATARLRAMRQRRRPEIQKK
jgi:aryl carrier-like protein